MKKVLITGIDSFTGKYLSTYLNLEKYEVYGTSYFDSGDKKFKCDITDKENIKSVLKEIAPNYIIHLSGISFAAHGNNEDFYKVNTIGTMNILESLVELNINIEKVILASSATVYGNQGLEILDESLCPMPSNHYGASKYAMECLAKNFFQKLPIIITRPFNYTGVGQADNFLIPKIVKHYREKKEEIELGNLEVSREFNDIDYVCEVYTKLLNSGIDSEIINISSNKATKLMDVIDIMNNIAQYNIKVSVNPEFVRKDEIKTLTGSTEKLYNLLGDIQPQSIDMLLKKMYEVN